MINIVIPCTANYDSKDIINTVPKSIDVVSQFIILYHSIVKNWTSFDYHINLFYNKHIPFNEDDMKRLSELEIDIFPVEPDYDKTPYMLRCNGLTHKLKNKSSHRLLLDCDTIAVSEPSFNLLRDWQAMYANSVISKKYYEYINRKFNYNIDLDNKVTGPLFTKYIKTGDHKDFFPHFNGGAILIKEGLCQIFKEYTTPSYEISHDIRLPHDIRHIGVQYGASFALAKMSRNWEPFEKGFNYLIKSATITGYGLTKFGKQNIKLLHYCGEGAENHVHEHFREYLI